MKQIITRKLLVLLLFCAFSFSSFAQDEINTEFINRMNYVFSPLEKNRVPNGLLLDYAMEFADLKSYNGVLTDSGNTTNATVNSVSTGGGQPIGIMQPYLTVNYIIATVGTFPARE